DQEMVAAGRRRGGPDATRAARARRDRTGVAAGGARVGCSRGRLGADGAAAPEPAGAAPPPPAPPPPMNAMRESNLALVDDRAGCFPVHHPEAGISIRDLADFARAVAESPDVPEARRTVVRVAAELTHSSSAALTRRG